MLKDLLYCTLGHWSSLEDWLERVKLEAGRWSLKQYRHEPDKQEWKEGDSIKIGDISCEREVEINIDFQISGLGH